MAHRRGRWTYDATAGWRLDDTEWVLSFDPLDGGEPRGAWVLYRGSASGELEAVDHFLDGSMAWVEDHLDEIEERWARGWWKR